MWRVLGLACSVVRETTCTISSDTGTSHLARPHLEEGLIIAFTCCRNRANKDNCSPTPTRSTSARIVCAKACYHSLTACNAQLGTWTPRTMFGGSLRDPKPSSGGIFITRRPPTRMVRTPSSTPRKASLHRHDDNLHASRPPQRPQIIPHRTHRLPTSNENGYPVRCVLSNTAMVSALNVL